MSRTRSSGSPRGERMNSTPAVIARARANPAKTHLRRRNSRGAGGEPDVMPPAASSSSMRASAM
jgi:hypothetical protein